MVPVHDTMMVTLTDTVINTMYGTVVNTFYETSTAISTTRNIDDYRQAVSDDTMNYVKEAITVGFMCVANDGII